MEKEKEKSRRKYRDTDHYDREKVRESAKDSKDRDQHRHHRSSREKSRDVDENEVQERVRESVKDSRDRDQIRHHRSSREESRDVDDDGVQERESDHYDREKARESVKDSKDRDQHKHHRSSREKSREVDDDVHHHRSDRRSAREYSVEREKSVDYSRSEREGSRDQRKVEKSHDPEELVGRRHNSKRKDRGLSEEDVYIDGGAKRVRAVEEKKGMKRFEEDANENGRGEEKKEKLRFEDTGEDKDYRVERKEKRRLEDSVEVRDDREERKEKRRFEDRVKKEEVVEVEKERTDARNLKKEPKEEPIYDNHGDLNGGGSKDQVGALELPITASWTSVDVPLSDNRSPATKVSSISNKNENKGVNSNRSHEVPGKSSTDGTGSDAGKIGGLSADALSKAKRALQMQKELAEKLKKIPLLKRDAGQRLTGKEETKAPSSSSGLLPVPATSGNSATATEGNPPAGGLPHLVGLTTQKYEAVKRAQELAAKMGFRQDPEFAPLINMFPGQLPPDVSMQPKPPKAPVLRLDALGREVDEYGNVINIPKVNNLSTLKVNINKQKKDAFQILKPELEVDPDKNPHFDPRMGIDKDKLLRPKRMSFQFVEEGKWTKDAEIIKLKSQFGEARTKELKAKQAQLDRAKSEPAINPNLIEVSERVISKKEKPKEQIPEIEWWDVPFLLSGDYSGVIDGNISEDKLKKEKITIYVQHPRPIEPPAEPVPPPPQPLKLTKKEQKKLRTQRRLAREKEKQEMIRQGLIEPPKPKVKMSNLMRVLGAEATQDPTKLEMEIRSAAADREQAHIDRNIARKLTPAERREKKERKLFDDPSNPETIVSVYKINNLSHPQARFKVDANAHENRLTGCAVISEGVSVVVVEGCPKSIKRYGKLMLRRIDWAAVKKEDGEDEEDDDAHDAPVNKCLLVWQGNVAKPSFNRFSVHECRTESAARKIFFDAGVAHYWELAVNFTEDQM